MYKAYNTYLTNLLKSEAFYQDSDRDPFKQIRDTVDERI